MTFKTRFTIDRNNKQTTGGVHPKRHTIINKELYLDKAGKLNGLQFENLSPVLEALASEIGTHLGFNVVNYTLCNEYITKNRCWLQQEIYYTRSKWFLDNDETIIHMQDLNIDNPNELYKLLVRQGFEKDINDMLIFDFIINMNDRHLKNFALVEREYRQFRFSPIYDLDSCLSINIDEDIIECVYDDTIDDFYIPEIFEDIDITHSFRKSNKSNLRLINKSNYTYKFIKIEPIIEIINKYELSHIRRKFIIDLISNRINYLNKVFKEDK